MRAISIRFKQNVWGNLSAYAGRRRIKSFGEDLFDAGWWASAVAAKGHTVRLESSRSFLAGFDAHREVSLSSTIRQLEAKVSAT